MRIIGLISASLALAHSWVEELSVITKDGSLGQRGYPRGSVHRSDPVFSDAAMTYRLPTFGDRVRESDLICAPAQRQRNETTESPSLEASPGDSIMLLYQENGHVTLPWLTPQKPSSGRVYIYSTFGPSEKDRLIDIHRVWNAEGTGGDGRGRLLGEFPFDDGRCFQVNDSPYSYYRQARYGRDRNLLQGDNLWCTNVIKLPNDVDGDMLTLYWVWEWPSNPGGFLEKEEFYTTCIDVRIAALGSDL